MAALSQRRKADRLAMATGIARIAQKYGASCDYEGDGTELNISAVHPSGLAVSLWLRSKSSQPDVHVIPWHMRFGEKRLSPSFGDVNPHHFRKATHVQHGWDALAAEIERGFAAAADGSAFQTTGA